MLLWKVIRLINIMINNNSSPVTVNAEQATTYAVEEQVNQSTMKPQGSVTPGSSCNA